MAGEPRDLGTFRPQRDKLSLVRSLVGWQASGVSTMRRQGLMVTSGRGPQNKTQRYTTHTAGSILDATDKWSILIPFGRGYSAPASPPVRNWGKTMRLQTVSPPLTPAQRQHPAFLVAHTLEHGIPPTIVEVCNALGFASRNAAVSHLRPLVRKGYLDHGGYSLSHAYRLRGVRVVIDDGEAGQRLREAIIQPMEALS